MRLCFSSVQYTLPKLKEHRRTFLHKSKSVKKKKTPSCFSVAKSLSQVLQCLSNGILR